MIDIRTNMINYIMTKVPASFSGKENWLGVKMSPHQSMEFINLVTDQGVVTNRGSYRWDFCSQEIISTIYQRLKLNEHSGNSPSSNEGTNRGDK